MRIAQAMTALSSTRPVFHSEADFQFALAWAIKELNPSAEIRLEYPFGSQRGAVDLVAISNGKPSYALELKYVKATSQHVVSGEAFNLPDSLSDSYYYACKDVARMERFVAENPSASAGVLVLSNRRLSWTDWPHERGCHAFRLSEGRALSGSLDWPADRNRNRLARDMRESIELRGSYPLVWRDYGSGDESRGSEFRYLLIDVPAHSL